MNSLSICSHNFLLRLHLRVSLGQIGNAKRNEDVPNYICSLTYAIKLSKRENILVK